VNGFRVHEGDFEAEQPLARLRVDQLRSLLPKACERRANVVDLVRDVVHPGAALREELPDGRVVAERGQELDTALAEAHRRGLDALVLDAGAVLERAAEEALVRLNGLVEVGDGDSDVVNSACLHPRDAIAGGPGTVGA
jgi:hypothetical protein